nr:13480_t:CDS:1 [Entrophospora candida]
MCDFLDGAEKGRRTRNGTLYYNEFQTRFWEKGSRNISNQTSPNNRNRRTSTNDRSRRRSLSPHHNSPTPPVDNNTSNTNIPDLQPPSYADATNTQQVNEDNEDNAPTSTENNPPRNS